MLRSLLKYLTIYKEIIRTNFSEALSFRLHFVLLLTVDLAFYLTTIASATFIFDHVDSLGGWSRDHFLFFISFMLVVVNLQGMLLTEAFWIFSHELRTGDLDYMLLRPAGAIFSIFFKRFRPATLLIAPVPWGFLLYYGSRVGLSTIDWLMTPPLALFAFFLMAAIELLIAMSMFWVIESVAVNFIRMQISAIARWPNFLYQYLFKIVFTVFVPVLLVGSAPVQFLFDSSQWELLLGALTAFVVISLLIRLLWQMGLRRYESASS